MTRRKRNKMSKPKEEIIERAKADLASRLGVVRSKIEIDGVEAAEFPNASLGAAVDGEMSMMMITPGWKLRLSAGGENYEYRATNDQLRLFRFQGQNFVVE